MSKDNSHTFGGAVPQKLQSCLSVLDTFLSNTSQTVVSTFIMADKLSGTPRVKQPELASTVFGLLGMDNLT